MLTPRVVWRDTGGHAAAVRVRRRVHKTLAPVKAQNRLWSRKAKAHRSPRFTPPHTFFFTREVDINLGYVWYRKDAATDVRLRHPSGGAEENPQYVDNFALVQRAARHGAAHGRVSSTSVQIRPKRRARRCFASRTATVQAGCRLQDVREPLPSAVHRSRPRVRFVRDADAGPDGDESARPQHHRPERFPRRPPPERSGAAAVQGSEGLLRGDAPRVGHRFPGDAVGGAERLFRRSLQHHVPEGTCTGPRCGRPGQPFTEETIRATARCTTPATPTDVQQMMDAEGATGTTRIRARRARPGIRI